MNVGLENTKFRFSTMKKAGHRLLIGRLPFFLQLFLGSRYARSKLL